MTPRGEPQGDDTGAVAIVVALLMTVILVLAAFAVDIGNAYAQVRQLSVAADADSLAAAAAVGSAMPLATCTQATLDSLTDSEGHVGAEAIAQAAANTMNTANNKTGVSEPVKPVSVTCVGNAIEVRVDNSRVVNTTIAGIIGISTITPSSYAVARYVRTTSVAGLRPWAVCDTVALAAVGHPNTTYWTPMGNWNTKDTTGVCGSTAPGQWGAVSFTGSNGAQNLIDWTLLGYPDPVEIPGSPLPADPGVTNSVATALQSLIGKVVLFPTVTAVTGSGNGAAYNTAGVVTVEVCGIYFGNKEYTIDQTVPVSTCWVPPTPTTATFTATATGSTTTNESGTTLTISSPDPSGFALNDSAITITKVDIPGAKVDIPGADKKGDTLSTTFASIASPTVGVLSKNATLDVTNQTITITYTKFVPGSLGVPLQANGDVIDHIQFRWVKYTSSYSGPSGTICVLSDPKCVGTTLLWK